MPQSNQPKPDPCKKGFSPVGDALQELAPIVSNVGLAANFLGAPEIGLPLLGIGGAMDLGGSYLKDRAAGRSMSLATAGKIATTVGTSIPIAKGVQKAGAAVAAGLGMGVDSAMNKVQEGICGPS